MFARVSTYRTGPNFAANPIPDEPVNQLLALPECRGLYFLNGTESSTAHTISLWESRDAMVASREFVNPIRTGLSQDLGMEILSTEEFEVLNANLTR